jgi:hypothetical protein
MLTTIDWTLRGPDDHAFMVGYLLAQHQQACKQLASAVVLLTVGEGDARIGHHVFLQADAGLVQLGSRDLAGLTRPDLYYELAPYIGEPDPQVVRDYARLRRARGYVSFDQAIERMVQAALAKFGA